MTVEDKLCSKANENETFFDYIRKSEKDLGLDEADVFSMTLEQIDEYIDFIDYLWTK